MSFREEYPLTREFLLSRGCFNMENIRILLKKFGMKNKYQEKYEKKCIENDRLMNTLDDNVGSIKYNHCDKHYYYMLIKTFEKDIYLILIENKASLKYKTKLLEQINKGIQLKLKDVLKIIDDEKEIEDEYSNIRSEYLRHRMLDI